MGVLRAEVSVQPELVRVVRHAVPDDSVRLSSLVRDRDAAWRVTGERHERLTGRWATARCGRSNDWGGGGFRRRVSPDFALASAREVLVPD